MNWLQAINQTGAAHP